MATMDRDTFIPLGTSIVKLLLIASGQGTLAIAVGEGAGLLERFRGTLQVGGKRAAFVEKIADDAAAKLLQEHEGISEADWHVAAQRVASLIDRLPKKGRLAAGYNWEELRRTLLELGGIDLRRDLADESAKQAFDWVLEVACQRIVDCFTEKEALDSILQSVEEVRAGIQRLSDRPAGASPTRTVVADHIEEVRHLAPDPLEDREREIAELEAFARGSKDAWYAMEAGMVSGKTALMSSFALNPPNDVRVVSFFARRIGGEGNDWKSFAYYVGAQLAEILGDEYIERVSGPASQDAEFRLLLRRAAVACRSDKNPQPLVLLIDGVDEDSYYERPDDAAAKSILSLLPRHLPDGVKVITASRPNPQPPEDIICDASRVVVSLNPSIIAQKEINATDIETFFKSDYAADIGAFIAACGGGLTVVELRQLVSRYRRLENVPTREIESCVDHSPGRMLTSIKFVSGDREVTSYTLGHDAVLRSVLHEIAPHLVGECGGVEDAVWWAQIRDKALTPYREVVRKWVEDQADEGWGMVTPNYLLSGACFNLMLNRDVQVMLDPGRYNEMWRRFGRSSHVLRMVDLECFEVSDVNFGQISGDIMASLLGVVELRRSLVWDSVYLSGLLGLYGSYFGVDPESVLDPMLPVDDLKHRLDVLGGTMKAAVERRCGYAILSLLPVVFEFLGSRRDLRGRILCLFADVFAAVGGIVSDFRFDGLEGFDLEGWIDEVLVSIRMEGVFLSSCSSFKSVGEVGESARVIDPFRLAEDIVERIEDPLERVRALVGVAGALVGVGDPDRARWVAKKAAGIVERIEKPWERVEVMPGVVDALVRVGLTDEGLAMADRIGDPSCHVRALVGVVHALVGVGESDRARRIAEKAASKVKQIKEFWEQVHALPGVVDALVRAGLTDEGLAVAERIENPLCHALALPGVVDALVRAGLTDDGLAMVERIEGPGRRVRALVGAVDALVAVGESDRARRVAEKAASTVEQIEDRRLRELTLPRVADALVRAGLTDEGVATVERVDDTWERTRAFVMMVDALVAVGDPVRARRVAEKAASTVEQIEDRRLRELTLSGVVDALVRAGLTDEGVATVEQIKDPRKCIGALPGVVDALVAVGDTARARRVAKKAASAVEQIKEPWELAQALVGVADALARAGVIDEALKIVSAINDPSARCRAQSAVIKTLVRNGFTDDAADAMSVEIAWVRGNSKRQDAADYCATLAAVCVDSADFLVDSADAEPAKHDRWLGLARSALARSWLYGAPVWDHFDILMHVAPELAVRLVDERILVCPEQGAVPESEASRGSEGPGGEAGSYR